MLSIPHFILPLGNSIRHFCFSSAQRVYHPHTKSIHSLFHSNPFTCIGPTEFRGIFALHSSRLRPHVLLLLATCILRRHLLPAPPLRRCRAALPASPQQNLAAASPRRPSGLPSTSLHLHHRRPRRRPFVAPSRRCGAPAAVSRRHPAASPLPLHRHVNPTSPPAQTSILTITFGWSQRPCRLPPARAPPPRSAAPPRP